jgi:hypothetical protein
MRRNYSTAAEKSSSAATRPFMARRMKAVTAAVGNYSTVDLSGLVPPKDGLLTSPSLREQAQISTSDAAAGRA